MDLVLRRNSFTEFGIFGTIFDPQNNIICVTLEHAYLTTVNGNQSYQPKLPVGTYQCVRGMHILEGMSAPFEAFEITGVPNHTGVLFHIGNYNRDSAMCVLLGTENVGVMITKSVDAFNAFMNLQKDVDTFTLVVK